METTDYVSYPVALALKKAGFDWECRAHYTNDYVNDDPEDVSREVKFHYDWTSPYDYNRIVGNTSAPLIYQAQKWLRDVFLLHVCANPAIPTRKWQFYIDDLNQQINPYDGELMTRWDDDMQEKADERLHDSYECALSAGIASALELINQMNN